jgi:ParB family chromosome partitioning protein
MPEFQKIWLDEIKVGARLRPLDPATVDFLAESIQRIGLQSSISVRIVSDETGETPVLIAGHHRLEALRKLGHETTICAIHTGNDRDARIWEIAENLHRAELSVLERSEHVAEWVRLTDEQSAQVAPKGPVGHRPQSGINAATRELGIERTQAQRAVKIDGLSGEAKQAAREAGISDNQSALLRISKEANPAAQLAAIQRERDLAESHKRNRETDRVIALTEAQQFGEWLLERTDIHELPTVISWLECCKPKDVIAALRREAS